MITGFIGAGPSPIPPKDQDDGNTTSLITVTPWDGTVRTTGAFLVSRVNLGFISNTCNKFSSDLDVAFQVATVLENTKLKGTTDNQIKRYGYILFKLEIELKNVLDYLTDLLLCSGRGGELWSKFYKFRDQASRVWSLLKKAGISKGKRTKISSDSPLTTKFNISDNSQLEELVAVVSSPLMNPLLTKNDTKSSNSLMELLDQARPIQSRQQRSPILIGLGLGFVGSYLASQFFGTSKTEEIEILNNNIKRNNKQIRLTNERIDILSQNITNSLDIVKKILDKVVTSQEVSDIHEAIFYNLDQLVYSNSENRNTFRLGEIIVTLLEQGILNPELLDLPSLKRIISEGKKSFPNLEFPIEISRFHIHHIVKIINIQRVSPLKFLMVIPLTEKIEFKAVSLIPHPVQIDGKVLVIPVLHDVLLQTKSVYIVTDKTNIYSISAKKHLLLEVEPVYNKHKQTCELAAVESNKTNMLKLCNFEKSTQNTLVVETERNRLAYFSDETKVILDCPDNRIRDTLVGLHKLPIQCDIETDDVTWPAKQTVSIEDTLLNDSFSLDSTYLPIITVNRSSEVHKSLRELINQLRTNDSFTIDFDYYGLTLDQVSTYSVIAQSALTLIVIINSIVLGYLVSKWMSNKKNNQMSPNNFSLQNRFANLRDSIREKSNQLRRRESLQKFRDSFRNKRSSLRNRRDSFKQTASAKVHNLKDKIRDTSNIVTNFGSHHSLEIPNVDVGTNTEMNWYPSSVNSNSSAANNLVELYPALPRYT